ncbi:MAG: CHC2 zinc finger domain-containing protein [Pirellulales bacterium]
MSGPFSDVKERVKAAVDIVDLVASYMPMRRQGRNYVALCPWHDDSRPSLQVNQERQTFKCWVCNLGGDIFSFVMQKEGVEFREALEMLAERAGIVMESRGQGSGDRGQGSASRYGDDELDYATSEYDDSSDVGGARPVAAHEQRDAGPDKPTMFRAMKWAVDLFHDALLNLSEAAPARDYLAERGISAESIEAYQLGFAPDRWDWLVEKAQGKATALRTMERVGLLGKSERGSYYDRFKGRVLFPIRDINGRPIALGGRVLPALAAAQKSDRPPAKYINSPETPLFNKHREFYGYNLARESIFKSNHAIVMEGYTDCIIAHQYGFQNAVAVLGTALGDEHVLQFDALRIRGGRVTLVLDGDDAGRKRSMELLASFISAQVDLRILTLPDALDPCDFLQQRGTTAFQCLIDSSVDSFDHAIQVATTDIDVNDIHGRGLALDRILDVVGAVPINDERTTSDARVRLNLVLSRLAREFRVHEEELRVRIKTIRGRSRRNVSKRIDRKVHEAPLEPLAAWERELLELALLVPDEMPRIIETVRVERLASLSARQVYVACCELWRRGVPPTLDRLLNEFEQPAIHNLLVELDEQGHARGAGDASSRLDQLLQTLCNREEQRRHREQVAALDERRLDEQEEMKSLLQMIEQKRNRQGISKPTDG